MRRLARLEPDVDDDDVAGVEASRADDETDLAPVHRHGDVRVDRRALDLARRRVHAGRDVDGEHGRARRVDPLDRRGGVVTRSAAHARAEQRVDHEVCAVLDLLEAVLL